MVLGTFIVDWAQELIGSDVEADAIVETKKCLPDAVQIFTPCTYGNGWMKVLNWNKFAVTLYDKHNFNGFRVALDLEKTKAYPDLYNWFMRLVPKKELPAEIVNAAIIKAGRNVLSFCKLKVNSEYEREEKKETVICLVCKEASTTAQRGVCLACRGEGYYMKQSKISSPKKEISNG